GIGAILVQDHVARTRTTSRRLAEAVIGINPNVFAEQGLEVDLEPARIAIIAREEGCVRLIRIDSIPKWIVPSDAAVEQTHTLLGLIEHVFVVGGYVENGQIAEILLETDFKHDGLLRLERFTC